MIDLDGITGRIARLDGLARGLGAEASQLERLSRLLAEPEQRAYVQAILDAVMGLDAARSVLTQVCKRMQVDRILPTQSSTQTF